MNSLEMIKKKGFKTILLALLCISLGSSVIERGQSSKFKAIAFYTAKNDKAHISFVHEANRWFAKLAASKNFTYDSTNNWNNMNAQFLSRYQVVLFLDSRPDSDRKEKHSEIIWKKAEHGSDSICRICSYTFRFSTKLGLVS